MANHSVSHPQQPIIPIYTHNSSQMPVPLLPPEQVAHQSQQLNPYAYTGVTFQNVSLLQQQQQQVQTFFPSNPTSMHMPLQTEYPGIPINYFTELPPDTQSRFTLNDEEETSDGGQFSHTSAYPCQNQQATEERIARSNLKPGAKEFHLTAIGHEINPHQPCLPAPESYIPPDGSASPSIKKPGDNNETETNASPEIEAEPERMPDIDISLLLISGSPRQKPDVDADMKYLFCQDQSRPAPSRKKEKNKALSKIQSNINMLSDPQEKGYAERKRIMESLVKEIDERMVFKDIQLPPLPSLNLSGGGNIYPTQSIKSIGNLINMSIQSFLPNRHRIIFTLSAPFLPGYSIPFSTETFSLSNKALQQVKKITKNKELSPIQTTDQLVLIANLLHGMQGSFKKKIKKLKETESSEEKKYYHWDLLIHSKFIAHMMLTTLLFLQNDSNSSNNQELLNHITIFFIAHLIHISPEKDIAEDVYLELIRALLSLLNHEIAESIIFPAMMGTDTKPETKITRTQRQKQTTKERLQEKLKKKNETDSTSDVNPSSSETRLATDAMKHTQTLIIEALNFCYNKPELATYYFSIFTTIYKSPIFCKKFLEDTPEKNSEIIKDLTNFICWMNHSLQDLRFCDDNNARSIAIISEIQTWVPKLSQLTAALAGRTPERDKEITDIKWLQDNLIKNPTIKADDKKDPTSKLKSLAINIEQLRLALVIAKLEENKGSRELEKEIDKWAKNNDKLTELKKKRRDKTRNQPTSQQPISVKKPEESDHLKSVESPHHTEREPVSGVTDFSERVTALCNTLDDSKPFEELEKIAKDKLAESLIPPAHKVYCFLEIALHIFHKNHKLIIRTATSMEKVQITHQKLVSLQPPIEKIKSRSQSTQWLQKNFSVNELTPKNMAFLASNTDLENVKKAKERLRNSLLFLELSIKDAYELLSEMKKPDFKLKGELNTTELITHFEICKDIIASLNSYNEHLHQNLVTYELPTLKTRLFEQLRLYGRNSFISPANHFSPVPAPGFKDEDEDALKPLWTMQQNKENYRLYNQYPNANEKINTAQLLKDFTQVHNELKSLLETSTQASPAQAQFTLI
ncbi:hypothetical protein [Endozoicomonas sp.]|uniref:hypothetical protein n=1 Tax=Endozoicomonas sp. TaxID=1892382 RepID=UPI002888F4B4|nr:hypothetical protein [Endozoicomonas sp.]